MTEAQIDSCIALFVNGNGENRGRAPAERYASFDYCFNYFQSYRERQQIAALASPAHMEASCLHLGFYLASWGMFRGSSILLRKSIKHYEPVIRLIATANIQLWKIDVDAYSEESIRMILRFGATLRQTLGGEATDTLITKVMLGVFGNVPAFDKFFRKGMGMRAFGLKSLRRLAAFYNEHAAVINRHQQELHTLDFATGQNTGRFYTKAKVIDMIGFTAGGGAA
ncbi:MAG: hypothetical protein HY360_13805 [Verrucomicrobia bacterium]|nr:hypothetical protein [Verrucomicrobiota bacterium]